MSSKSRDGAAKRWETAVDTHRKVIAEALEAATAGSVISSVEEVTATPSGTFVLVGGDKLTIEKGRVVGRPEPGDIRAWAMFALMPEDRTSPER